MLQASLFEQGRSLEVIPPTKGALEHHIKRAAYQAGHIWSQSLIRSSEVVSPGDWGWRKKHQQQKGHHLGHFYHTTDKSVVPGTS